MASVLSKTRRAHRTRLSFDVQVHGNEERAWGSLIIRLADGQEWRREIPMATCTEVLSSMAVIAAMILDGAGLDDAPAVSGNDAVPGAPIEPQATSALPASHSETLAREAARPLSEGSSARWTVLLSGGPQSGVAPELVPRSGHCIVVNRNRISMRVVARARDAVTTQIVVRMRSVFRALPNTFELGARSSIVATVGVVAAAVR